MKSGHTCMHSPPPSLVVIGQDCNMSQLIFIYVFIYINSMVFFAVNKSILLTCYGGIEPNSPWSKNTTIFM